jgi:hypothetical protein
LEVAGRYEEIFAPEMMVPNPVYHFHAGGTPADLRGQDNVKNLYHMWAETNQSIFFAENEQVYGGKHSHSGEWRPICRDSCPK